MKRGFFFLGFGFYFLFDLEVLLRHAGGEAPYAVLDLFPDVLAWLLMGIGLFFLTRKYAEVKSLRNAAVVHFALSVFTLLSETAFFAFFFTADPDGAERILAMEIFEYALRVTEFIYCVHLFDRIRLIALNRENEPKLASACKTECIFIAAHFAVFAASIILKYVPASGTAARVADWLQYLFFLLVIWFGGITLIRCDLKMSE